MATLNNKKEKWFRFVRKQDILEPKANQNDIKKNYIKVRIYKIIILLEKTCYLLLTLAYCLLILLMLIIQTIINKLNNELSILKLYLKL